jgi:hypothetical protein
VKGAISGRVAGALAERGGIGVRYGCHCAHLLVKRILHVPHWAEEFQGAMLTVLPKVSLPGVVRASLGIENTEADVDALLRVLGDIAAQGRRSGDVRRQMDDFAAAAWSEGGLDSHGATHGEKSNNESSRVYRYGSPMSSFAKWTTRPEGGRNPGARPRDDGDGRRLADAQGRPGRCEAL